MYRSAVPRGDVLALARLPPHPSNWRRGTSLFSRSSGLGRWGDMETIAAAGACSPSCLCAGTGGDTRGADAAIDTVHETLIFIFTDHR